MCTYMVKSIQTPYHPQHIESTLIYYLNWYKPRDKCIHLRFLCIDRKSPSFLPQLVGGSTNTYSTYSKDLCGKQINAKRFFVLGFFCCFVKLTSLKFISWIFVVVMCYWLFRYTFSSFALIVSNFLHSPIHP